MTAPVAVAVSPTVIATPTVPEAGLATVEIVGPHFPTTTLCSV